MKDMPLYVWAPLFLLWFLFLTIVVFGPLIWGGICIYVIMKGI